VLKKAENYASGGQVEAPGNPMANA